jgi:membrane protease YdiL (CAAX protease family)
MTEEVVFRLFVMSVIARLVYRNAKRKRLALAIVLVGSAVIFAFPHLERPLPGKPPRQLYRLTATGRIQARHALERAHASWLRFPHIREA